MKRTKVNAWHPKQLVVTEIAILQLFSTSSFLSVNKALLPKFGPEPAIWLSFMIDRFLYLRQNDKIKDNWFYFTHAEQTQNIGITEYGIKKCKTLFSNLGIIKTKYGGLPKKEWYSIDTNRLAQVMGITGLDPTISGGQEGTISGGHYKTINSLDNENEDNENKNHKKTLLEVEENLTPSQFKKRVLQEFDKFWQFYPRKVAKQSAKHRWLKIFINEKGRPHKHAPTFQAVIRSIEKQAPILSQRQACYIPHASTWLNEARWEDDLEDLGGGNPTKPATGHYEPDYKFREDDMTL